MTIFEPLSSRTLRFRVHTARELLQPYMLGCQLRTEGIPESTGLKHTKKFLYERLPEAVVSLLAKVAFLGRRVAIPEVRFAGASLWS